MFSRLYFIFLYIRYFLQITLLFDKFFGSLLNQVGTFDFRDFLGITLLRLCLALNSGHTFLLVNIFALLVMLFTKYRSCPLVLRITDIFLHFLPLFQNFPICCTFYMPRFSAIFKVALDTSASTFFAKTTSNTISVFIFLAINTLVVIISKPNLWNPIHTDNMCPSLLLLDNYRFDYAFYLRTECTLDFNTLKLWVYKKFFASSTIPRLISGG